MFCLVQQAWNVAATYKITKQDVAKATYNSKKDAGLEFSHTEGIAKARNRSAVLGLIQCPGPTGPGCGWCCFPTPLCCGLARFSRRHVRLPCSRSACLIMITLAHWRV